MPDAGALLETLSGGASLGESDAGAVAKAVAEALGPAAARIYPGSLAGSGGEVYAAAKGKGSERLVLAASRGTTGGRAEAKLGEFALVLSPWNDRTAKELRSKLAHLAPGPLGRGTSAGLGDRLGSATVGHARAVRGTGITPVFAQQSIREMTRTGRSPDDVMLDATWGVFVAGWREPWGADADHLKTTDDADACMAAGFVMYTIDPGDHVDDAAAGDPAEVLKEKLGRLPWDALETTLEDCRACHAGSSSGSGLSATEEDFARAAVKYGRAVAHAAAVARHIAARMAGGPFEIEISVDETATPTTPFEHRFVAAELARLGVTVDSLAVRFVGEFEKGVDYKGDLDVFRRETQAHAAVAREFGGYKLSVHSGSDKFSVYPVLAEAARGAVHLKTAGTSYLEAVRAVAECELDLFREIAKVARAHYDEDRATYHVSGKTEDVPEAGSITLEIARALLDHPGARQVFHVTYGSVLAAPAGSEGTLGEALKARLDENEELHWQTVARHITRHLAPFAAR